ncbi:NAD(P)-binding protein [Streptomyces hokutonensis]|uniref:NAD(P)-binding protein n=1 Tax=Streptomyces hokutonensis TaxID=1306990 RepID=UPI0033EEEFD0
MEGLLSELTNASGEEDRGIGRDPARIAFAPNEVDVLVIGAGATGIYQLCRAREEGFSALLLEAGHGVGGIWYWNRALQANSDAARVDAGKSFPWWEERAPRTEEPSGQPDIGRCLDHLNHIVDRSGVRRGIRFGVTVKSAVYDDPSGTWRVTTTDSVEYRARFLVATTGVLSAPAQRTRDFICMRVALIETGLSGTSHVTTQNEFPHGNRERNAVVDMKKGRQAARPNTRSLVKTPATTAGPDLVEFDTVRASDTDPGEGVLKRLGIRGREGLKLKGYWANGPRTYLGVMTAGFPNLFFPGGRQSTLRDSPQCAGDQVDLVTGALVHARDHGHDVVEVELAAEEEWTNLMENGETRLTYTSPNGAGWSRLREMAVAIADHEYAGFIFSKAGGAA